MMMGKKEAVTIILEGWLARSTLMGYELFAEKPELRPEEHDKQWRMLADFRTGKRGLYAHLGHTAIPIGSSLHVGVNKVKRVKLTIELSTRARKVIVVDEVETANQPMRKEKTTIGRMSKRKSR